MGQGQSGNSAKHVTTEQLSHELAQKFAKRCFTSLELYSFQDVFRSLADNQDGVAYLKEDTIARFLEIPDILGVSSVIFQMVSYLGAFPFGQDAPAVLGFEQMIMVVVIMTERYQRVLKKGSRDRTKLLFRSLAVYDRRESRAGLDKDSKGERTTESLAHHTERLASEQLESLRKTADNILAAFVNVEKFPGVKIHQFNTVIPVSLPFIFNGFNPLFEHFLFSKNIDFTKRKNPSEAVPPPPLNPETEQPLLPQIGEILDLNVLSQLSFFLPGERLFRRLRLLYSGGDAGFSMGSFETRVFNWRAPTILLVAGNRIEDSPTSGPERVFADTLPPKRFPDSNRSSRVVFGVYLSQPWRQTHKECFGETDTLLFQLEPVHEVFHASVLNKDYVAFSKPPSAHPCLSFGCPHPKVKQTAGLSTHVDLGAVSLYLDSSFEFGVFTHNYTSGGGAFHNSETRRNDFQDRFEIESLEVWGCGGDEEAEQQRARWAWEEREAEARRKVNLGTGDIEADRALLEMAGLIGGNRSGGSMN
ncbi:putative Restriction of telomere capping 5 protein [Rutstroemia sp. NJR-2017a BBW]|nr:putative Restriction of telomere capping 5 protein [Rutstroemia sp. NJR-2017a BBW]